MPQSSSSQLFFHSISQISQRLARAIINKIISIQFLPKPSMIESPIKRKSLHYPKDFVPANSKPTPQNKRFTFNEDYQIDASIIKKYSESIEEQKKAEENQSARVNSVINPQKIIISQYELSQDAPLGQHASNKRPDINAEVLKKPRFALKNNEEISENDDHALEESSSPGSIRKQLQSRQTPLPLSDPCRIELVQATSNKITKIPQNYIKYRSSANIDSKTWRSSQKDILEKFQESRMKKSMNQLPTVSKPALNQSFSTAGAKDIYDNFRKRQQSTGAGFGKVNAFLMSLKKKEVEEPRNAELPSFAPSAIQKIKEDINQLTRSKKKANAQRNEEHEMRDREESSEQQYDDKKAKSRAKKERHGSHTKHGHSKIPEYLVSYRSSLSYLKDLHTQTSRQEDFRLTVKIPKLFTESLIYKNQEKSQLYQTARTIFSELKIPYENLVIKRYTNCTMMISRNICLIWHFDGKRYLGGWQTQYLDEGCKHGLGLQWQPKNYVYYGEFVKNKKEGLGIYKDRNEVVYVGYWKKGKRYEYAEHDSEADEEQRQRNSYEEMEDDHDPYEHQDNYYEYL